MLISRKVIVILSKHYLNSPRHMYEMDLANERMYNHQLEDVIVIHIDNGLPMTKIPKRIAHTLRRNTLIEWNDNDDSKACFKIRINEELERRTVAADIGME